jgi:hypothetical protein
MNDDAEPSTKTNSLIVDYAAITLEELAEYKMERGSEKYASPANYTTGSMLMRYIRHIGEFLRVLEDFDHELLMEYIADIQNVGSLLFPKIQEEMIQKEYEISMVNDQPHDADLN